MKIFKRIILSSMALFSLLSLAACFSSADKFELSQDSVVFDKTGQTTEVVATVAGEKVIPTTTLSETGIVTLSGTTITAVKNGSVNIYYSYEGFDDLICVVTVDSDFAITTTAAETNSLSINGTLELGATVVLPDVKYNEYGITYSSSNEDVAQVNSEGIVTGKNIGQAVITMTSVAEIEYTTTGQGGSQGTKLQNATKEITVIIGNEWDSTTHASLVGTYEAQFDWLGFGSKSGEYADAGMVRAFLTLEIYEDGTFKQTLLNAKRANYSFDETTLTFTNAHTFNRLLQSSDIDDAVTLSINGVDTSFDFLSFTGYELSGISNFTEEGTVVIDGGNLIFVYPPKSTDPLTQIRNLGSWESAFTTPYKPLENQCAFHADMTMLLAKQTN